MVEFHSSMCDRLKQPCSPLFAGGIQIPQMLRWLSHPTCRQNANVRWIASKNTLLVAFSPQRLQATRTSTTLSAPSFSAATWHDGHWLYECNIVQPCHAALLGRVWTLMIFWGLWNVNNVWKPTDPAQRWYFLHHLWSLQHLAAWTIGVKNSPL